MARRIDLTDSQWGTHKGLLPNPPESPGGTGSDNRLFRDAVLWIACTVAPLKDLPERFGRWSKGVSAFRSVGDTGVWKRLFDIMPDPELERLLFDFAIVRAPGTLRAQAKTAPNKRSAAAEEE